MNKETCRILLIEDNSFNTKLIEKLLFHPETFSLAEGLSFELSCVGSISEAKSQLDCNTFNVILLDLLLPDSNGIESLFQVKEISANTPIIVLTGSEDEALIVKAFQFGANGFLHKKNLEKNLLIYAIRLAIERQQYNTRLEQTQQQQQQEKELQGLEELANLGKTSITARMFGSDALRESIPDIFEELVQDYANFLDLALEERAYKVEHNLSENLRQLADKLGFLKASPRDIIEIHTKALREKNQNVTLAKSQAYVSEGRLIVLELMGYLTSYYRKYYIGLSNINLGSNNKDF
jgi:DNA-binding NarL/FixJ family response regulator